jgi:hypothetical protein
MRGRTVLLLVALLSASCSEEAGARRASRLKSADRKAIEAIILEKVDIARRAWEARDARIMIPDTVTVSLRSPDGQVITPAEMRDALQKRMDGVSRVDTMMVRVDSFLVVTPDSVLAYSTQRFVRLLRRPDGYERLRFSVVVHEQSFIRREEEWVTATPEREVKPRSWWGDESPPHE